MHRMLITTATYYSYNILAIEMDKQNESPSLR